MSKGKIVQFGVNRLQPPQQSERLGANNRIGGELPGQSGRVANTLTQRDQHAGSVQNVVVIGAAHLALVSKRPLPNQIPILLAAG